MTAFSVVQNEILGLADKYIISQYSTQMQNTQLCLLIQSFWSSFVTQITFATSDCQTMSGKIPA